MNQIKSVYLFLSFFSLLCLWLGQNIGGRQGLLIVFFIVFALNIYIYFFSDSTRILAIKKRELEGNDPWGVLDSLSDLCKKAYIPIPRVYFCPFPTPTSLALGKNKENAYILLSENIVDHLNPREIKALLALEVAKIKRQDTLTLGIFSQFLFLAMAFSHVLDFSVGLQWLFKKERRSMPFTYLVMNLMLVVYKICIPPRTYYEMDKLASEIYPKPREIAEVLWKLDSYAKTKPMNIPIYAAHLFIMNPLSKENFYSLLQYQPAYDKRIQKLVGYFPI